MKNIKIAVCDGNKSDRDFFAQCCQKIAEKNNVSIEVLKYDKHTNLLNDIRQLPEKDVFDILLLDVEHGEKDGIELAGNLREIGYVGQIIFLAYADPGKRIQEVFEAQAADFLLKDSLHRFESLFNRVLNIVRYKNTEYVLYNRVGEYRQIAINDIRYFEVRNYLVCVHYNDQQFEFMSPLKKVEMQLSQRGFFRIHRIYVVSFDHVRSLVYGEVTLSDGTKLPVGRAFYAPFKEALEQWRKGRGGSLLGN